VQITKARIHLAERDSEISGEELRSALVSAISDAESTYWDLVLASRELSMRNESVAVAQKLLNDNRERHRLNKLAEVEVYQAETGLKVRQTQYAAARQRLSETINRIRSLLSESSTSTAAKYSAADSPNAPAPNFDKDAVMLAAIEHNPDYSIQKLELEKSNIRLVVADNMRWPRLDLTATYGQNGLDNDSSQAHDFLVDDETHSWALLLEFQMAIGGRQAHSELEAARLRKQQAILNLKRIEIELGNAVDTVLSRIESAHDQRNTFAEVVAFNEKLLEDEQTLMASGKSDSRQVLEIEEELFEAKQSEVRSRIDYQKALLALATLQGTLLEERNITIDKE
jgi:outer membrane protein TolC